MQAPLLVQAVAMLVMGLLLVCVGVVRLLLPWKWSQLQQQERQRQEQRGRQQAALQVWQGQAGTQRLTWRWMPPEVLCVRTLAQCRRWMQWPSPCLHQVCTSVAC